jgi:hypothetical protein
VANQLLAALLVVVVRHYPTAVHPQWLPDKVPVDSGVSPSSCVFLFKQLGQNYPKWQVLSHFQFLLCARSLYFGGGQPLHNVQSDLS